MPTGKLRAYVVDDELPALKRLTRMIEETGRIEIAGSTTNPKTALQFLSSDILDVLFLDIQMPEMDGFDLLSRLPRQPLVIFATAYDQYALKAFEVNSIDYLLKPVEPDQLERAIGKLERLRGEGSSTWLDRPELAAFLRELSRNLNGRPSYLDRIAVRIGDRTQFLDLTTVTHFFTRDRLTYAATETRSYCVEWPIAELEQKLDPTRFFRIHRGVLLNVHWIDDVTPAFGGRLTIRLKDHQRTGLTVARDRTRELKTRLGM
jgi:two-component system LytT family response regulator